MELKDIKVGSKVRCIDAVFKGDPELPFRASDINLPKKNSVYIVREIDTGVVGGAGIRLKGVDNKKFFFKKGGEREPIFALKRFTLAK